MGLNRQQRRAMAKRNRMYQEVVDEYEKEVSAYKDRIDGSVIEQFFVAAGMALHNLYGWKANGIGRFWKEMDRIVCNYQSDESNFQAVRAELRDKAGVEINWTEDARP